jgi:hypothetical protein
LPLEGLWWGSGREDRLAAAAADDEIDLVFSSSWSEFERIFWVPAKML